MVKGIILAGGTGSRLYPASVAVNKHLLPIYDKPMIYYPLTTLLMAGCDDIAVVTSSESISLFARLLGDGSDLGIKIHFIEQKRPGGIAHALEAAKDWSESESVWVVLGDNIFYGQGVGTSLQALNADDSKCICFAKQVMNTEGFGVIELFEGTPSKVIEKPKMGQTSSNWAITGLYKLPVRWEESLVEKQVSERGEQEITSVLEYFMNQGKLSVKLIPRGTLWMDAGTTKSLSSIGNLVGAIHQSTGRSFGSPEEASLSLGLLDSEKLQARLKLLPRSEYVEYLEEVVGLDVDQ